MADRKWRSDFRFGLSPKGAEWHLLLKFGDDISSSFRDSEKNFDFSKAFPAAILDFFEKQNYTYPLIFRALSNAVDRISIGPIGAEKKFPIFPIF